MKRTILTLLTLACAFGLQAQEAIDDVSLGPWVTAVRTDSTSTTAKILWTSGNEGLGWVEFEDGRRVYDTFAGRRTFGKFHCVTLTGLQAGAAVRYRVGGRLLITSADPYKPIFGDEYSHPWTSFKNKPSDDTSLRFSVFNDIHNQIEDYASLASQVDSAATDFIFLCGDIASAGNRTLDEYIHYEIEPLGTLTAGIPVQFARGNHEGRGTGIKEVARIYPQAEEEDRGGEFYYTFRQGPAAFIVFDGGETSMTRSELFCGDPYYEDYIARQALWAARALQKPQFKNAPLKICLVHVPMIDHQDKSDYDLQRYLNSQLVPLLNEAGLDLMIGADLHEYMYCEKGTMGNDFPILVNSDDERLDFTLDGGTMVIRCYNPSGELTHAIDIPLEKQ